MVHLKTYLQLIETDFIFSSTGIYDDLGESFLSCSTDNTNVVMIGDLLLISDEI